MRLTLRIKLVLIVGTATVALMAVLIGGAFSSLQQSRDLADVEGRLIPRLRLGPEIQTRFERLRQQMRDAVAAQDPASLSATDKHRDELFEVLRQAAPVLNPVDVAALQVALSDYLDAAHNISMRLIQGEGGEAIIHDMEMMQARDQRAVQLLERVTAVGEPELKSGFAAVRVSATHGERFRLVMGGLALLLLCVLSLWMARGLLRALSELSQGFTRFGTGEFSEKIAVLTDDELGDVAKEANLMAESLERLGEQRDRNDWVKGIQIGLTDQVREDLEPRELARRALWYLCQKIGAVRGSLYLNEARDSLRMVSTFAGGSAPHLDGSAEPGVLPSLVRVGEGLVGQAALFDEIMVIADLPEGYASVWSSLGAALPRTLVLVPLTYLNRRVGVMEFALFEACSQDTRELLNAIREPLALALSVADSRAQQSDLLSKMREQALRLVQQEEELRARNATLLGQQTELRRANDELEVQRAALSERNDELEEARARVQQKAEELARVSSYKSQFLANMSHELRTPLNSMLLLSSLLAENPNGNLTPKQVEHARTVHSAGKDLLTLINQVLDLAKIEAGKQEVDLEPVALRDVVEQAKAVFMPLAAEKRINFNTEIDPSLPHSIVTDRYRLQRILANLLGNAIKFTDRGSVSLRAARVGAQHVEHHPELAAFAAGDSQCVIFEVSDTGVGIAPEAQVRVFSPFEQADSSTSRRYVGTGLGLAIARESAGLLGGDILLRSTLGVGTTFTCILPDQVALAGKLVVRQLEQPVTPTLKDDRDTLTATDSCLLVIEDDLVLAEQLMDLTRGRDFKVLLAKTGVEGLQLAMKHQPRGIILDVGLPDVDCWSVMERLKHDPVTRLIPVHFVSATDAPARGLALGAVGYLVKPTTRGELMNLVRAMTRGSVSASRKVLVVEDDQNQSESLLGLLRGEGVEAEHVSTAAAAMDTLARSEFGCMILDLGLPDMDGLGLLEGLDLREDVHRPRVIVHTARTLTRAEHRRIQQYAEAVVQKGADSGEQLMEEVRAFIAHMDGLPLRSIPPPNAVNSNSLRGFRILITDDDMRTVYALSALLRGWGAEVLVADTGREALRVLENESDIDVVLMDVMMPEMDGYEAMRQIRREKRFAELPVVALTASAMLGERERCLEAGANDYLTKPLDGENLLAKLHGFGVRGGAAA